MIPRYTSKDFLDLWSPLTKFKTWLDVELAVCKSMETVGAVPTGVSDKISGLGIRLNPDRIDEIEELTRHDVIAFLTHIEELIGEDLARWLHFGLTSSDICDTSFALLLLRSCELIDARLDNLIAAMLKRVDEHRNTPMIGRSHGMHAQPVTFGLVLAGHVAEFRRAKRRMAQAKGAIGVGKLSGAVGTCANLCPEIESAALAALGLRPETVATQVVARDRHAEFFCSMAMCAAAVERFATNVRHWQRTEVGEAAEGFGSKQKGSSAMPHKRNPILSENLCGLSRIVRSAVVPALENIPLWHERDISHSSAERIMAPDVTSTLAFMLDRAAKIVNGLDIYPAAMRSNLSKTGDALFSEAVLLALVSEGMGRQQAYEIVQRCALSETGSFRSNLEMDDNVIKLIGFNGIRKCFNMEHSLRHVNSIIDRVLGDDE